jgi:hypothetical protein
MPYVTMIDQDGSLLPETDRRDTSSFAIHSTPIQDYQELQEELDDLRAAPTLPTRPGKKTPEPHTPDCKKLAGYDNLYRTRTGGGTYQHLP